MLAADVKNRFRHPGTWTAALGLMAVSVSLALVYPSPRALGVSLTAVPLALALFLCPLPWRVLRPWPLRLALGLALALGTGALMTLPLLPHWKRPLATAWRPWSALSFLAACVLVPVGYLQARGERLAEDARQAQRLARDMAWMGQRGTFSPRLLTTSLQHLAAGVGRDAEGAERGLLDLANLYRRWLVDTELPLVPLTTERSLVEQYVALEARRWGARLAFSWGGEAMDQSPHVPPMLLQPLLEPLLIRHPVAPIHLRVVVSTADRGLLLDFHAEGDAPLPEPSVLQELEKRIQACHGAGSIALQQSPQGWEVRFRFRSIQEEVPCA